ncbi:MAG: hypothetical protein JXB88_24885 [Spirochaetales bacterium]|nr:hypothetical protein [Spirochaetales bacterium]
MNRKATITVLIFIFILTLTLTTCDLLNKDIKLILPPYLYDGDTTMFKADAVIQIFDVEDIATIIELEIIPADEDDPDNQNNDSDDLSKILMIPSYVQIPANELSVEFKCESIDTEMEDPYYKDVSIRAFASHYNEAIDTLTVHDVTPESKFKAKETPGVKPGSTPAPAR